MPLSSPTASPSSDCEDLAVSGTGTHHLPQSPASSDFSGNDNSFDTARLSTSSQPTSVEDEDEHEHDSEAKDKRYQELVAHWPFAPRIFGDLVKQPDFPVLPGALVKVPDISKEEWESLKAQIVKKHDILQYFWFRYDSNMRSLIGGAASYIHQLFIQGMKNFVTKHVVQPMDKDYSLPGSIILDDGAMLLVRRDHIEIPDYVHARLFQVEGPHFKVSLDVYGVVVEVAGRQTYEDALIRTAQAMVVEGDDDVSNIAFMAPRPLAVGEEGPSDTPVEGARTPIGGDEMHQRFNPKVFKAEGDPTREPMFLFRPELATYEDNFDPDYDPDVLTSLPPLTRSAQSSPKFNIEQPDLPRPTERDSLPIFDNPGQTVSDVTFIVVSIEEGKQVAPEGVDINVTHWVELPCPPDCISGGWATRGRVYVGPLQVFVWAFQGAKDHEELCALYHAKLDAWLKSGRCIRVQKVYQPGEEQDLHDEFQKHWQRCLLTVRKHLVNQTVACTVASLPTLDSQRYAEKIKANPPNVREPEIPTPSEMLFPIAESAAWRTATQRFSKVNHKPTKYGMDGLGNNGNNNTFDDLGDFSGAIALGENVKSNLCTDNVKALEQIAKQRKLEVTRGKIVEAPMEPSIAEETTTGTATSSGSEYVPGSTATDAMSYGSD
ncbi:uncharacterized protein B0H18DRAFT_1130465 [Fomitopsis serialis]|uniref:uncharacterized protein n=1 Tax=Fomitopsis serialis TaxID=139415 RepID=UPI0020078D96|nr:uncharacterized protein B0H18DRAFT_1130465 [Neoantrodia serialis]KAH9910255.1 hypothetical protein B0H18DRAFT_1130465 [Neoantrodia serialis]